MSSEVEICSRWVKIWLKKGHSLAPQSLNSFESDIDALLCVLLQDLTQVAAGTFAHRLKKAVDYGSNHVYSCILCSQKGFICELCHHPKVIYPFELTTTTRVTALIQSLLSGVLHVLYSGRNVYTTTALSYCRQCVWNTSATIPITLIVAAILL